MSNITPVSAGKAAGVGKSAADLLPLVYEELRRLAGHKLANEAPGQTLQPTALVHEAWLRLAGKNNLACFQNRAHFFGAAAEAMRRILIERARRKQVLAKGGYATPQECTESELIVVATTDELLAVHEALEGLATEDPAAADLVKLRYFVGMSMPEAAEALGIPLRSAERLWTFAKAWLRHELHTHTLE